MEIKISVLFFFSVVNNIRSFTGVAGQCPSGGKLTPFSHSYYKYSLSEHCVAQSTCGKYQDDLLRLGHAEL